MLTKEIVQARIQPFGFEFYGEFTGVSKPTEFICHCKKIFVSRATDLYRTDNRRTKSCGMCNAPNIGDTHDELTVIAVYPSVRGSGCMVDVKCSCGNVKNMRAFQFSSYQTCGQCNLPKLGERFKSLVILELIGGRHNKEGIGKLHVKVLCDCGKTAIKKFNSIQNNSTTTCGHCKDPNVGDEYGKITITKVFPNYMQGCDVEGVCSCGNIMSRRLSSRMTRLKSCGHCDDPDVNTRWGSLVITDVIPNNNGGGGCNISALCDCGKTWSGSIYFLRSGRVKSCGHCNDPEVGQRFNAFTITKVIPANIGGGCSIEALCDCGNTWKGPPGNIKTGWIQSCGCENSRGEKQIIKYLTQLKMPFEHNKALSNKCQDKTTLRFDFILHDGTFCIEYQGKQHYLTNCGWGENVENSRRRDQIKRDYCSTNGITLYEIPYTEFDNLEEIIEDLVINNKMRKFDYPEVQRTKLQGV